MGLPLLRDLLEISQLVVSNCIVYHLLGLFFYLISLFLCFVLFLIKLSLSQPASFATFMFLVSLPHPTGQETDQAVVWCSAACWFELQHVFLERTSTIIIEN